MARNTPSITTKIVPIVLLVTACMTSVDGESSGPAVSELPGTAGMSTWQRFDTTADTLTLRSSEPLLVNSPFFGIEVRKNGVDITDDIVGIETLSRRSWRYTFRSEVMNTPGDEIEVSLENRALATPGHYVAVREGGQIGTTVQSMYELLSSCETGTGACAGPAVPGLLAAVKGMSMRYMPRDLEPAEGVYDFSPVFADAAFLASVGMKLHVMFTVKSFASDTLYDGDGITRSFPVPDKWDGDRSREIHVYVGGVDAPFSFDATRKHVRLASAPPAGKDNVAVVYARDPFPEYTWHLDPEPPVGGWYAGPGGPNTGTGKLGSHGFVHAPWRRSCVAWMRRFVSAFDRQWTRAIAADPTLANAIESVSIQETANALEGPGYTEAAYREGLVAYARFYARAVRRRALFGQLLNHILGGNKTGALGSLAAAIIPWGARLEGPDLFNDEPSLEDKVYADVHRALHDQALTMIWHQNASYREPRPNGGYYTPAQQFEKARRGVANAGTASGTPGLEAEYVFWNMSFNPDPMYDWRDALPVIAAHPVIRTTGNDRYLWRRIVDRTPIADQVLNRVNP